MLDLLANISKILAPNAVIVLSNWAYKSVYKRKIMALEKEISTYKRLLPEWSEHAGQYVLIKNEEVCGFFSSYDDAIIQGYQKFGLDPFLVKQVNIVETAHFISRLNSPCHISPSK